MKSILYAGAILMAGACIYGFADYRKANNNKEFKSLYHSEAATPKASISEEQVNELKNIEQVNEKTVTAVPESISKLTAGYKPDPSNYKEAKVTDSKRKATKRKKLNYKLYSRAALEERPFKAPEEKTEKAVTK